MNSIELIETIRAYIAMDGIMRGSNYLDASSYSAARRKVMMSDGIQSGRNTRWSYPMLFLLLSDDDTIEPIASNNEFLTIKIVASSIVAATRIKDRLRFLLDNKTSDNFKHEDINAQGQILGYDIKVRGLQWVSAATYDDVEQGSERLHRINCVIKMIVGD